MKLLVSLAILALAAAQPPAANIEANIEEVVPENLAMNDDGSVADDFLVQSYSNAKEALAKNGEAGCKKLADDTEKAVRDAVEAEQNLINAMDNGGDCHTTGDSLVTAVENKLKQAQTAEQTAKKAKEKAEGQNISLGSRSFKQLESILSKGKCNKDIIMGSDYAGAVATVKAKRNAHTSAKGAITTAKGAVKDAKKEAATLVNTCMCNLIKEHDAAVKAANKKNRMPTRKHGPKQLTFGVSSTQFQWLSAKLVSHQLLFLLNLQLALNVPSSPLPPPPPPRRFRLKWTVAARRSMWTSTPA